MQLRFSATPHCRRRPQSLIYYCQEAQQFKPRLIACPSSLREEEQQRNPRWLPILWIFLTYASSRNICLSSCQRRRLVKTNRQSKSKQMTKCLTCHRISCPCDRKRSRATFGYRAASKQRLSSSSSVHRFARLGNTRCERSNTSGPQHIVVRDLRRYS